MPARVRAGRTSLSNCANAASTPAINFQADLAESLAFSWVDTKQVRPAESRFYAFLNDENRAPSTTIVDALGNYDIVPVIWSARDSGRQELAA